MESLSPSIDLLFFCRTTIEEGQSLRTALQAYSELHSDILSLTLRAHFKLEATKSNNLGGADKKNLFLIKLSPLQRSIYTNLVKGLSGQPIHSNLIELEEEALVLLDAEIEKYVKSLPIKLLFPLLFLIFPSFVMLGLAAFQSYLSPLGGL